MVAMRRVITTIHLVLCARVFCLWNRVYFMGGPDYVFRVHPSKLALEGF